MTYKQTEPLQATFIPSKAKFYKNDNWRGSVPGAFRVDVSQPSPQGDECEFYYCCPCGCGLISSLHVGNGFKPEGNPTWKWNGSVASPTLEPSINHKEHWHGFLKEGVWTVAK